MQDAPSEGELPECPWEIVSQRKHLPASLRQRLDLPVGILRVSRKVDTKIRTQHASDLGHYENLDEFLPRWVHVLPDPTAANTWQIYIPLDAKHWLAVIVGKDQTDSYYLISVFRIRDRNVRNRVKRALED